MASKERTGKLPIPSWWMERVLRRLDEPEVNLSDVAGKASAFVGRKSPWTSDSISKFKAGQGQTWDMIAGLSYALGIVRPFFAAPTEAAANIIAAMVSLETQRAVEDSEKLAVADRKVATEIRNAIVDAERKRVVVSSDHGESRGDGVRSRSPRRRRP